METTKSSPTLPSLEKILKVVAGILAIMVVGLILFRILCVDYIEQHEFGYKIENLEGGKMSLVEKKGYVVTPPIVTKIHTIDLRPRQVCQNVGKVGEAGRVDGINGRVLNCKLVEFNPLGLTTLIAFHGIQDGDVSGILGIYAYDQLGRTYPFLTIKEQSAPSVDPKK